MKSKLFSTIALVAVLGASVAAFGFVSGEGRSDCPGKVECPLTGELVCRDKCPLGAQGNKGLTEKQLPSCCRGKQQSGDE